MPNSQYILEFFEIDKDDTLKVGDKAANLGEMTQQGFPIPPGFVIPDSTYNQFIQENELDKRIRSILSSINFQNPQEVSHASTVIQNLVEKQSIPKAIGKEIAQRYQKMGGLFKHAFVSVRPSVSSSDSFSGEHETYLNIYGEASLLEHIRKCWASLFTPRAILFRENEGIDNLKMSVVVQQMIESEVSGIAFTSDPQGKNKNMIVIESIWGLGQFISDGNVTPDRYVVNRMSGEVVSMEKNIQETELVKKGRNTKELKVQRSKSTKQKLDEKQIKELGTILRKIHNHYFFPQVVEWAFAKKKFYILETSQYIVQPISGSPIIADNLEAVAYQPLGRNITKGLGVSGGIATGIARKIARPQELSKFRKGEILITTYITPDFVPFLKNAAGIISEQGGVTSHAAIMARELGLACIVGAEDITKLIKDGEAITMNGVSGEVVRGNKISDRKEKDEIRIENPEPKAELKTATKIYVNLSNAESAKEAADLPIDGVGLIRGEFLISQIGIHPKHLIKTGKQNTLVSKIVENLEGIAQEFENRTVIYRTSDLKTNEYRNLEGGGAFEPKEENPLLGLRGALRYIVDPEVFELELLAVKKVREKYKNVHVCIPFVRSPQELLEVKRIITANGLMRGPSFQIWMMVELPINVLLIKDYINVGIDGISIGTNDLTMLLTGIDRDNKELAHSFSEMNPGVLWSLEHVIKAAQEAGISSSICGQAASTYDSLVEDVVKLGITSVSVDPHTVGRVQKVIWETERRIGR